MSRLRLVLDVSCLGHGALGPQHRTGLYQVARAYLDELSQNPTVTLGLYSASGNRLLVSRYLKSHGLGSLPWVGNPVASGLVFACRALEFLLYRSPARLLTPLASGLVNLSSLFRSVADRRALRQWEAYLSPMEAIPREIRKVSELRIGLVVHDLIPLVLPQYRQDANDPTRWFPRLWATVRDTDVIFTVSEATRRDWLRLRPSFPAERVVVAPNAIHPRQFHPQAKKGQHEPFFFALATIEPRKRVDALEAGYRAYRQKGGRIPLMVGGINRSSTLAKVEGMEYLGFVKDEDLPGLYSACTAFVSLSEYEGFGLPILEAMACGAPVVVSPHTSHPEVAGEAGLYVEPDDPEAIAAALLQVSAPQARANFARLALAEAARFSWRRTVDLIVSTLQRTPS